jgi:hypothetical protein
MQKFDHNIGFWEKRQFFAGNWQKSQKIVIMTPGHAEVFERNNWVIQLRILQMFFWTAMSRFNTVPGSVDIFSVII